ncbi:GFA family protein [Sphingosinicella sp. YJ22]|uniref:GFA family protein n=1 Tax=Sphingosinicella sp. YJ22 TaxID=1104780 RepID=UPI00140DE5E0|nr:GFA family protein [Sphingosinicella sp. YJ22]
MTARTASCLCGQLKAECTGDPFRISVCHCLDCKKRSGSAFAYQARWPEAQVRISGEHMEWERVSDAGNKTRFYFCPQCGGTIAYRNEGFPDALAIPVGGFADVDFPAPGVSVFEERKPGWLEIKGDGIERE